MTHLQPIVIGRLAALLLLLGAMSCTRPDPSSSVDQGAPTAPLLDGMGVYHQAITTESALAQRYFDQGMVLAYGFNHAEAARAFGEAARLDPECALCFWGQALVAGPNINAAMEADAVPVAWEALTAARARAANASEREQALIAALAKRYAPEPPAEGADRSELDRAYAAAMRDVVARFPDDVEARTLLAEALMDLNPWDYWLHDGTPQPWTEEILSLLESAMADDPTHPGAHHLYLHAVEASRDPGRGEAAADRLSTLVPGAGHLVHMPSHIYIRVGRYHDASAANERAIEADNAYVTQCHAQGLYPLAYMPHNRHFLWSAATFEGRAETALTAAREMAARVDAEAMRMPGMGTLQHFWITPLYAQVRFGRWDEILAAPVPPDDLPYPKAVWHYARGIALTALDRLDDADIELARLVELAADPALEAVTIWDINGTAELLAIASEVLAGELAARRGDLAGAIERLGRAAHLEDNLRYDEPPTWHQPARLSLGGGAARRGAAHTRRNGLPRRSGSASRERLGAHRPRAGLACSRQSR